MSGYGPLAFTGPIGIAVLGYTTLDQWWIAALAVLLVAAGVVTLRLGWRRGRTAHSR